MKKHLKKLSFLLLAVIIAVNFNSCSKDEGNVQSTNNKAEIIDYNIKVKQPNTIYPVRDYVNLITKEEIIVYGNYNENLVLDKITQIVYQNTESHLEFSFDRNGVLTTITNYDLSSNTINDQVYIKEENSKFYLSRNNETIALEKGGDVQFKLLSDDLIGSKLNSVLKNNALLFSHLNGSDGLAKSRVGVQKAQVGVLPVVVGILAVYAVVKFIQNNGIYKITKGTQIESHNVEELYQNCRNAVVDKTNSKSSSTNNSNYACYSNIAPVRENNHNLNLSFCGTKICVKESVGIVISNASFSVDSNLPSHICCKYIILEFNFQASGISVPSSGGKSDFSLNSTFPVFVDGDLGTYVNQYGSWSLVSGNNQNGRIRWGLSIHTGEQADKKQSQVSLNFNFLSSNSLSLIVPL